MAYAGIDFIPDAPADTGIDFIPDKPARKARAQDVEIDFVPDQPTRQDLISQFGFPPPTEGGRTFRPYVWPEALGGRTLQPSVLPEALANQEEAMQRILATHPNKLTGQIRKLTLSEKIGLTKARRQVAKAVTEGVVKPAALAWMLATKPFEWFAREGAAALQAKVKPFVDMMEPSEQPNAIKRVSGAIASGTVQTMADALPLLLLARVTGIKGLALTRAAALPAELVTGAVRGVASVVRGVKDIPLATRQAAAIFRGEKPIEAAKALPEIVGKVAQEARAAEVAPVAQVGAKYFRGDTTPIDIKKYKVDYGITEMGKEVGGAFSEGPGIYFTTDMKNASAYGKNITEISIPKNANIFTPETKNLPLSAINKILKNIDKETMDVALSNYAENPIEAKRLLMQNIQNANGAVDQLMTIWSDVFYHQNPEQFMQAVSKTGIQGIKVPKQGGIMHLVLYDRGIARPPTPPPPITPLAIPTPPGKPVDFYKISIGEGEPKKTVGEMAFAAYQGLVSEYAPIEKLGKLPTKLAPGKRPADLLTRVKGIASIAESPLYRGIYKLDEATGQLNKVGESLESVLKPVGDIIKSGTTQAPDNFRRYLIAQHDIEMAAQGLKGVRPEISKAIVAEIEASPDFPRIKAAADAYRDWSIKATFDPLAEVGAISQATRDATIARWKSYAPMNRIFEGMEDAGYIAKTKAPIFKLKGSDLPIRDPLESSVKRVVEVNKFVERQRLNNAIAALGKEFPELGIKKMKVKMTPVATTEEGAAIFRPSKLQPPGTFQVFKDGKRTFYEAPDDILAALKGSDFNTVMGSNVFLKFARLGIRMLRAGATLTPEFFLLRNPERDIITQFVYSKYNTFPGVNAAIGLKELFLRGETYKKFMASGAANSMFLSPDRLATQATLKNILASPAKRAAMKIMSPLDALAQLSEWTETAPRLGEFKRAGQTLKAAGEARDITLDFGRIGEQGRYLNSIVAFSNANIQGMDKLRRSFAERPMQTAFKAIAGITTPSVGLWFANHDDPEYRNKPQWERDLFWHIRLPDGQYIRVSKPFELGIIFGTIPEHFLEWLYTNDPQALISIKNAVASGASPGVVPTLIQPGWEAALGRSMFTRRDIVPKARQGLPTELQYGDTTSETAKWLARNLIKTPTGGIAPAKIDFLVRGHFAGLGKYGLDIADSILGILKQTGRVERPGKVMAEQPFVRAIFSKEAIGTGSQPVSDLYDFADEVVRAAAGVKAMEDSGEGKERIMEYVSKYKPYFALSDDVQELLKEIGDMNKGIGEITRAPNMDAGTKREKIDGIRRIQTKMANDVLPKLKAAQEKVRGMANDDIDFIPDRPALPEGLR